MPSEYGLGDRTYVTAGVGSTICLRQRKPGETSLYLDIVCDTNQAVDTTHAANVVDFDSNRLQSVHGALNIAERRPSPWLAQKATRALALDHPTQMTSLGTPPWEAIS